MRCVLFAGLCLLAGANHSFASEATSEEAQRLVGLFHQYLGLPQAGEPDFVRVEPRGDAYDVTLDLHELARPFERLGFTIDTATLSFAVEPLPDGTWRVNDVEVPSPLSVRIGETKATYRWGDMSFDGIFDPALGGFARWDNTFASIDTSSKNPQAQSRMHTGEQVLQGSASDAGNGTVNLTARQTEQDLTSHTSAPSLAASPELAALLDFSYGSDSIAADLAVDSLEAMKLNALWAYGMSRWREGTPSLDNETIREMLTDLLPVYRRLDETGVLHGLRVTTALGEFGIEEMGGTLTLPGLVPDGEADVTLRLAGSSYPQDLVPSWAQNLVATEVEVAFNVSGFNLEAPARRLISEFDMNATPMLDEASLADAFALAVTDTGTRLSLRPSVISSPLLTLRFSGEMTLDATAPAGSFEITAVGLDAAIAAVRSAGNDPVATQVLGVLSLAKGLAEPTSDGAARFLIEMKEDGSVSVNGQTMWPTHGRSL